MDYDEIQSEEINEIALALAKAQGAMDAAEKSANNPHLRSKYADLASVIDATRPALAANGLAVAQIISEQVLVTILAHESGQWLRSYYPFSPVDQKGINPNQAMGSAISYARRFSYESLVCGARSDDDDGQGGNKPQKEQTPQPEPPKEDLRKRAEQGYIAIARDFAEYANTLKDLLDEFGVEELTAVTDEQLPVVVANLTKLYKSFFDDLCKELMEMEEKRGVPRPHIENSRKKYNVAGEWKMSMVGDLKKYKAHLVEEIEKL
jgi:hypothetical protein